MLGVFDEAEKEWGAYFLVGEVTLSLVRQWAFSPILWKWFVASLGGFVLLLIAFGSFLPWDKPFSP